MGAVRIAVEGCGHGTLHAIYASIARSAELKGWDGVDLVIICGDFQAVRNSYDLNCMSVPPKYREIGDFHEYYSGQREAPYPTIFIGGNHEASNHLWELYYGGWAAPNIYYMGAANVVRFGPLRIAGLSGIWKRYNYRKPHHERIPYSPDDVKSSYHVREWDVRKLLQVRTQVDIGLSHDWPRNIEWLGDWKQLFRKKEYFEKDARDGNLGSAAAKYVLDRLRPPYWFSAHLHVKFVATIRHEENLSKEQPGVPDKTDGAHDAEPATNTKNDDEIDLDMDEDENPAENRPAISGPSNGESVAPTRISEDLRSQLPASFTRPKEAEKDVSLPTDITNSVTRFLSLDKCLPQRDFLQLLEIEPTKSEESNRPYHLAYDKEWLAITRVFANELEDSSPATNIPENRGVKYYRQLIEKEEQWVDSKFTDDDQLRIPKDFALTAPVYDATGGLNPKGQPIIYNNHHTQTFCDWLEIPNPFQPTAEELGSWGEKTWVATPYDSYSHNSRGRGRGRGENRGGWRGGRGRRG